MRKLILISAVMLAFASASAQAGQSRGLVLAVNDTPAPATTTTAAQPPAPQSPQATQAQPEQTEPVQSRAARERCAEAGISTSKADLLPSSGERRSEGAPDRRALRHLLVAGTPTRPAAALIIGLSASQPASKISFRSAVGAGHNRSFLK